MKRRILTRILNAFLYPATFILIWTYVGLILMPKNYEDMGGDVYFAYKSFFDEEKDSIDVMFSGNSNCYKGCIPMEFYEQTGATCYNIGGSSQSAQAMEARIRDVLKYQSPKLIIFDVDCLYQYNKFYTGSNRYRFLPFTAPIFYHNRWSEIEASDFFSLPKDNRRFLKGYQALLSISGYQINENYMQDATTEIEPIEESVVENMKNIQKMCQAKGTQMLFISVPTPVSWNNKKHNGIVKLANEFGVDYLDLNMPDVNFGFDYTTHIADAGYHCNFAGAELVTKYISDYVNEHYHLEDRRTNPKYETWKSLDNQYQEYIKSFK